MTAKTKNIIRLIKSWVKRPDLLIWIYPVLLIIPNLWLGISETYSFSAKITNLLLPLGIYYLIMGAWKRTGLVTVLLMPIAVLAAFQIVLLFLYGESIIAIDMFMNVVTTNVGEATELLGNLLTAILTVVAIYLPPLTLAIYQMCARVFADNSMLSHAIRTGLILTGVGTAFLLLTYLIVPSYSARRELFPLNVSCNMVEAAQRMRMAQNYHRISKDFSYNTVNSRPDSLRQVYVMVIGETSRADNWQLFGYDRPTNPRLSQRNDLFSYGRAMSESNTTHKSVPMLLSCLTADNFGDSVMKVHSILDAFGQAGYNTVFITNQLPNHSYIDHYGQQAKSFIRITDNMFPRHDHELLDQLRDQLDQNSDGPLFVVLHTYGSHHRYRERYTDEYRYFTPDDASEASAENRKDLINAYDNSIVYTDALIDSVINMLDSLDCRSAMIYTSDHGEDIFDDSRERFLHASPTPTFFQLHVPLILWMSPEYRNAYPEKVSAAAAHRTSAVSSTRTVFDTLLSLAGISSKYARPWQALTDASYREPDRRYLTDYNEGVELEASGFRTPDLQRLRQLDNQNR